MAPSPIPAPLPPWARALIQIAPLIPNFLQELLEFIGVLEDATSDTPGEWRQVQLVFRDAASVDTADRMITTLDIVNITGGLVDGTWTDGDYTTVNTEIDGLVTTWCQSFGQGRLRHVESRYYRRAFNPMTQTAPFAPTGPPDKIFVGTAAGAAPAAENMPSQVAVTHTEKTAYPRHWGRMYWPFPRASMVTSAGYVSSQNVDQWAAAVQQRYATLMAAEFFPVVPVTSALKVPTRGLLTTSAVQVDNIFDVIRRRRINAVTHRASLPVP